MTPHVKVFWGPKRGNTVEEYEDAFAHQDNCIAVADGATESSFADLWAQALVSSYASNPPKGCTAASVPLETWLKPLQKEWHANIAWDKLPWYAEEKARSGAFAALLGVNFSVNGAAQKSGFSFFGFFKKKSEPRVKWQALAVGDSNLFQIRQNRLHRSFPLEQSTQFDSRPLLLSSNPQRNSPVWQRMQVTEGDCEPGDLILLATDAMAQWFLAQCEGGKRPWEELTKLKTNDDFAYFIEQSRQNSKLRNDDTTLLICEWKEQ